MERVVIITVKLLSIPLRKANTAEAGRTSFDFIIPALKPLKDATMLCLKIRRPVNMYLWNAIPPAMTVYLFQPVPRPGYQFKCLVFCEMYISTENFNFQILLKYLNLE